MTLKGEVKALGAFTYDSMGKKLRFRSNESHPTNTSIGLDLLMFFDEVGFLLNSGMPVFTWCFFLVPYVLHCYLPWCLSGRGYSMRLTAKIRVVRKNHCTAPYIPWMFPMMRHTRAQYIQGVCQLKGRELKSISGQDRCQTRKVRDVLWCKRKFVTPL